MDAQQYVAGSPVPWSGRDTLSGVGLALAGALVLLGVGALASRAGLLSDVARTLVAVTLLEVLLLAVAWFFAVRKRRLSLRALGFRTAGVGAQLGLPLLVLLASISLSGLVILLVRTWASRHCCRRTLPTSFAALCQCSTRLSLVSSSSLRPWRRRSSSEGSSSKDCCTPSAPGEQWSPPQPSSPSAWSHWTLDSHLVLGLLLGWLFLRVGSIWACFTAHAFQNALALSLAR